MRHDLIPCLRRVVLALGAGGLAAMIAACGGGGSSAGVGTGGTGSFAVGSIGAFGSIIVNGVRFEDDAAQVLDADGQLRTRQDLRLGMVVEVLASDLEPDADGSLRTAHAQTIRYGSEMLGPVEAVDPLGRTLTVLGQRIDVPDNAVIDIDGEPRSFDAAGFAAGQVLEVHGYLNVLGNGRYTATRIERVAGPVEAYRLRGTVRELDPAAQRFRLGNLWVVAGARIGEFTEGQRVRVRLDTMASAPGVHALQASTPAGRSLPDRNEVEVEGLITSFTSAQAFEVEGLPVQAPTASLEGDPARLGLGVRVVVEGFIRDGVLVATAIEIRDDVRGGPGSDVELSGRVQDLDRTNRTFTLRGLRVRYDADTEFDGGSEADLANGRELEEVEGRLDADGFTVYASEIEFD
jgi:hypothetical protein